MKRADPKITKGERVLQAQQLSAPEVRFLVANYYLAQDLRKRVDMQIRHTGEKAELPILKSSGDAFADIENDVKKSLLTFAELSNPGKWLLSVEGIGPVIAAGLLAHVDIMKSPTVGHIWRFAGLDRSIKWLGSEYVRGFVKSERRGKDDWQALVNICREVNRRPLSLLKAAEQIPEVPSPETILKFIEGVPGHIEVIKAEFHADNILNEALTDDDALVDAYKALYPDLKFNWTEIQKTLSKRPYNAQLKQICFHAGASFARLSGRIDREDSFYGALYRQRKQYEIDRNERGDNAERAKNFVVGPKATKKTKDALAEGKLHDGQLDRQARWWAVKMFLSHFHEVLFWDKFKSPPPKPFTVVHLGHAHKIMPPGFSPDTGRYDPNALAAE